jgi:nitroreductase
LEFKEVVTKRRSIRKFLEDDISKEALVNIPEAGRFAPSAGNCQPWHFIVVTNIDVKMGLHVAVLNSAENIGCSFRLRESDTSLREEDHGTNPA